MPKRLLCSSKPVMVVTALVAVLGITGTAYGAKLITGLDIRDGSITTVDLAKGTQNSLQGDKGDKGSTGAKGAKGNAGAAGARRTRPDRCSRRQGRHRRKRAGPAGVPGPAGR